MNAKASEHIYRDIVTRCDFTPVHGLEFAVEFQGQLEGPLVSRKNSARARWWPEQKNSEQDELPNNEPSKLTMAVAGWRKAVPAPG